MTNELLVQGRECGACTVCCVNLTINDPELQKLPGVKCKNTLNDGGCKIYQSRPKTCRDWYCMWRFMPGLDDSWRPDLKGIVIKRVFDGIPVGYESKIALDFEIIGGKKTIHDIDFINTVGGYIAQGFACFMSCGKPRTATTMVFLNDLLFTAIQSRDINQIKENLSKAYKVCVKTPKDIVTIKNNEIVIIPAKKK